MLKKLWSKINQPESMKKLNGWLALVWFVLAFPICIFLANSIPLLVFISVYAIVTGHWSSWIAGRVEVQQTTGTNLNDEDRQWLTENFQGRHDTDAG
jgi:hypothetical protein